MKRVEDIKGKQEIQEKKAISLLDANFEGLRIRLVEAKGLLHENVMQLRHEQEKIYAENKRILDKLDQLECRESSKRRTGVGLTPGIDISETILYQFFKDFKHIHEDCGEQYPELGTKFLQAEEHQMKIWNHMRNHAQEIIQNCSQETRTQNHLSGFPKIIPPEELQLPAKEKEEEEE